MRPDQLRPASFVAYAPRARQFAEAHLPLLQRLPLTVCPSFLKQVKDLDTSFPAESSALAWQFDYLQGLPVAEFAALVDVLASISLTPDLERFDWVRDPAGFVTLLAAHLWSSGQMDRFRGAAQALFAAVPVRANATNRIAVVVLSRELAVPDRPLLRKLSRQGTVLTGFEHGTARQELAELLQQRSAASKNAYAHWYVDGGVPWPEIAAPGVTTPSYSGLADVRRQILGRMDTALTGSNGAELMRDRLFGMSPQDAGAAVLTEDPVLQRFYTELFTQSSGPQIFSTSFVQWTGRELARRAQPETLLLRYAPRQNHRDMNELFALNTAETLDPHGSFQDAEMNAYYNWLEMKRISAPGKLTFVALLEDHPFAVIVGSNAPAGVVSATPMSLKRALSNFSE